MKRYFQFLATVAYLVNMAECTLNSSDPCQNFVVLSSTHRQHTINENRDICDNNLQEDWYRLDIEGRPAEIPTVCIKNNVCGTQLPLRLNLEGRQMPLVGETVDAYVCTSFNVLGQWDCCVLREQIRIRNCGRFYIYYLRPTDRCPVAYCAQEIGQGPSSSLTKKRGESAEPSITTLTNTTQITSVSPDITSQNVTETDIPEQNITENATTDQSISERNITEQNVTEGVSAEQNITDSVTTGSVPTGQNVMENLTDVGNATENNATAAFVSGMPDNTTTLQTVFVLENGTRMTTESATTEVPVTHVSGTTDVMDVTNQTSDSTNTTVTDMAQTTVSNLHCMNWPRVLCRDNITICYLEPETNQMHIVCSDISGCGILCDSLPDCDDESDETNRMCQEPICIESEQLCLDRSSCFTRCDGHTSCNTTSPGEDEDGCPGTDITSSMQNVTLQTSTSLPNLTLSMSTSSMDNTSITTGNFSVAETTTDNFNVTEIIVTNTTSGTDIATSESSSTVENATGGQISNVTEQITNDTEAKVRTSTQSSVEMSTSHENITASVTSVYTNESMSTFPGVTDSPVTDVTDTPTANITTDALQVTSKESVQELANTTMFVTSQHDVVNVSAESTESVSLSTSGLSVTTQLSATTQLGNDTSSAGTITTNTGLTETYTTAIETIGDNVTENITTTTPSLVDQTEMSTATDSTLSFAAEVHITTSTTVVDNITSNAITEVTVEDTTIVLAQITGSPTTPTDVQTSHPTVIQSESSPTPVELVTDRNEITSEPSRTSLSTSAIGLSSAETSQTQTRTTETTERVTESSPPDTTITDATIKTTESDISTVYGTTASSDQSDTVETTQSSTTRDVPSQSTTSVSSFSTVGSAVMDSASSTPLYVTSTSATGVTTVDITATETSREHETDAAFSRSDDGAVTPAVSYSSPTDKTVVSVGMTITSIDDSSATDHQTTSSVANMTDHTVVIRKEKGGLFYKNFGLFVFLVVTAAVVTGICIFGLIGYTYRRRLRSWNPTMVYQDAYGDVEKKTLSFGREKHGIESPIPDFDILRDEKKVEETSLSQASTLALGPTPGRPEPPFDDSLDEPSPREMTNGKPSNGLPQENNEVAYVTDGQTNEGFEADDNVDGIVPVDELDVSPPRVLFPWIENAEDTKL